MCISGKSHFTIFVFIFMKSTIECLNITNYLLISISHARQNGNAPTYVIPVFEAIAYARAFGFITVLLAVHHLAGHTVPGCLSMHWELAVLLHQQVVRLSC